MTRRLNRRQLRKMIFETMLREEAGVPDKKKEIAGEYLKFLDIVIDASSANKLDKRTVARKIAPLVKGKSGHPLNPIYTFALAGHKRVVSKYKPGSTFSNSLYGTVLSDCINEYEFEEITSDLLTLGDMIYWTQMCFRMALGAENPEKAIKRGIEKERSDIQNMT